MLQRESDQVAEAALGHRVLARKQAVVRVEADLMTTFKCVREDRAAQIPRRVCRNRTLEEDPEMRSATGPRPLQRCRHAELSARTHHLGYIDLPRRLVEIDGEEPTGFVFEQRIDAHDMVPKEVAANHLVVERQQELRIRPLALLPPGATSKGWRVARSPISSYPAVGVDVLAAPDRPRKRRTLSSSGDRASRRVPSRAAPGCSGPASEVGRREATARSRSFSARSSSISASADASRSSSSWCSDSPIGVSWSQGASSAMVRTIEPVRDP